MAFHRAAAALVAQHETIETHQIDATKGYDLPAWFDEVNSALRYADHIVLSGNPGDLFPSPISPHDEFNPLVNTLWDLLRSEGFRALLIFDPVAGLAVAEATSPGEAKALKASSLPLGKQRSTLSDLIAVQNAILDFVPA